MKVAIHQPQYLPLAGILRQAGLGRCVHLLGHGEIQEARMAEPESHPNQGRLAVADRAHHRPVPRAHRPGGDQSTGGDWVRKHCQALRLHYGRAPFWGPLGPQFARVSWKRPWERVSPLNVAPWSGGFAASLRITRPDASSPPNSTAREEPTDRLIDLCRAVGGTEYLAGQAGPEYMDAGRFIQCGNRPPGAVLSASDLHPAIYAFCCRTWRW